MIAQVTGTAVHVTTSSLVIEVGGMGLTVLSTPSTLADITSGARVTVHTHLIVREESLTLFGFATLLERDAFVALQSVTGVGPRLALAMLAVHAPGDLAAAISRGDKAALERVPGVGPKVAARLLLELYGKLPDGPVGAARPVVDGRDQVAEALVSLGWSAKDARVAVDAVAPEAIAPDAVPTTLRAALRRLGGGNG